jgi:hypothetical protein
VRLDRDAYSVQTGVSVVLDVIVNDASVSFEIDAPFQADTEVLSAKIERFASSKGADIRGLDVRGLIPKMIRGIAGCEHGCPANAHDLVSRGYKGFDMQYVEGGILTARKMTAEGTVLSLKMFPDF